MEKTLTQKPSTKGEARRNSSLDKTRDGEKSRANGNIQLYSPSHASNPTNNGFSSHQIFHLQGTIGNRAVGRLIQAKLTVGRPDDEYEREADQVADTVMRMTAPRPPEDEENTVQAKPVFPTITTCVQRAQEDEEEPLQMKSAIQRQAEDPEEEEQDSEPVVQRDQLEEVAEEETKKEEPIQTKPETIQRLCPECEKKMQRQMAPEEEKEEGEMAQAKRESSIQRKADGISASIHSPGAGAPLSPTVRARIEPVLGVDLGHVRVHSDSKARESARALQAKAFTNRNNIWLGHGQSAEDTALMAHEATHVVQQAGGVRAMPVVQRKAEIQRYPIGNTMASANNPPDIMRNDEPGLLERGLAFGSSVVGGVVEAGRGALETGAELVGSAVELGSEALFGLVNRLAPGLVSFLRGGIGPRIMELLCRGLDRFIAGTIGRLEGIDFVSELETRFRLASENVQSFIESIRGGISDRLGEMLEPLVNSLEQHGLPFLRQLQRRIDSITQAFSRVWETIGRPAVDFLGEVGGAIWEGITSLATWLWDLTEPLRALGSRVWNAIKQTFNIAWDSSAGARSWITDKATEMWESLKQRLQPVMGPLRVIGGILVLLSPFGPIVVFQQVIMPLWRKLKWLWDNWNTDDILVRAREILQQQILPGVINGVASASGAMASAANWIVGMTGHLSEAFGGLFGALGVSECLRSVTRVMNFLSNQFTRLAAWARNDFAGLLNLVRSGLEFFVSILRPILEFLIQLALTIINPFRLPTLIAGALWQLVPDKLKPPLVTFLFELFLTFIRPLPLFATGLGPLGEIVKQAIIGFLEHMRNATDEIKIMASNKMAMILGTGSLEFIGGLLWGILRGIWDGLTDPFQIIFMLVQVAVRVGRFLYEQFMPAFRGIIPGAAEPAGERSLTQTQEEPERATPELAATRPPARQRDQAVPGVPPPSPATAAALQEAVNVTAGTEQEWQGGQAQASSQENATEGGLFALLSSVWSGILTAAGRIGSRMAEAFVNFLRLPDFEIGNKIGWVGGTVIFEVVLYLLTAGAWAGATAARPVLRTILRLLDLGGEILGGLMRALGAIARPIMSALGSIGGFLSRMPFLRSVIDKITTAFRAIFRYGDEAAAARRGAGEVFEETAEEAGERAAREAMQEAGERAGRETVEEAGERAGRETAEEAAQRGGRGAGEEAGERTGRETAEEAGEKAVELPIALAAARGIEATNDAANAPVSVLIAQLSLLKRRFRWIDRFEARPSGIPGQYSIYLVASDHKVGDYTSSIEEWVSSFPRKNTPTNTPKDLYEIRHTGPENIQVSGGGESIWADGIRPSDATLLETKYIGNPERSPFIAGSDAPDFIRDSVVAEVDDEFRRYAAVIHDAQTPVEALEVITNDSRAIPFFEDLLQKYGIPGRVVIKS